MASWDAAYRGLIPDEIIDARTVDVRTQLWRKLLERGAHVLYERAGWSADGSEKHDELGVEVRYRLRL